MSSDALVPKLGCLANESYLGYGYGLAPNLLICLVSNLKELARAEENHFASGTKLDGIKHILKKQACSNS